MERIETIKNKIIQLKELDYNYAIFGSYKHKYEFNNVLTEEQIVKFENLNNIILPQGYREFLKNVGNGGAGPAYGLYSIDNLKQKQPRVNEEFLLHKGYIRDQVNDYSCLLDYKFDGTCTECSRRDFCLNSTFYEGKDTNEYRFNNGAMRISFSGCTYYERIVLNGKHSGEVWSENEGEGLIPMNIDFLGYYTTWLDQSLNSFLKLKRYMDENVPFDNLMTLKGTSFNTEIDKIKAIAGLLKIEFAKDSPYGFSSGAENIKRIEEVKKSYKKFIKIKKLKFFISKIFFSL